MILFGLFTFSVYNFALKRSKETLISLVVHLAVEKKDTKSDTILSAKRERFKIRSPCSGDPDLPPNRMLGSGKVQGGLVSSSSKLKIKLLESTINFHLLSKCRENQIASYLPQLENQSFRF